MVTSYSLATGIVKKITALIVFFIFVSLKLPAQDNSVCLGCHDDPDISMDRNGRKISLTVKKYTLPRSVHNKLKCVDCHQGYDPDAIPHKEGAPPVTCTNCHKEPFKNHLFHPRMRVANGQSGSQDVNCKGCHKYHDVTSPKTPESPMNFVNSTTYCGTCHGKEREDHLNSEHYVQLSHNNPNAPTCIFCHTNPITKGYPVDGAQLKVNQEKLCLHCHLRQQGTQSQFSKTLINYEQSVHGQAIRRGNKNAAVCIDCHGTHRLQRASRPTSTVNRYHIANLCGKCHTGVTQEYLQSTHGIALKRQSPDAPTCTYCHGEHNIQMLPNVPPRVFEETHIRHSTYVRNKMVFCIACHGRKDMMSKYGIATVQEAHAWLPDKAVHWESVRCVDCHSSYAPPNLSHLILPPDKTIKRCEECHAKNSILITKLYKKEKELSRLRYGFINGTILSNAYVIGTTRNLVLDTASVVIFGLVLLGIAGHGFIRLITRKRKAKKCINYIFILYGSAFGTG